jgi:hypothetical protein
MVSMDIAKIIGDPRQVDRELAQFRRTSKLLSADRPRLVDLYAQRWVALYDGTVRAVADTVEEVLAEVEKEGIPKEHVIVRFVDKELRTMIL